MSLPSPSGLLKKQLDSAVIEEANKEVSKLITSTGGKQSYISSEATITKYAAEHSFQILPLSFLRL